MTTAKRAAAVGAFTALGLLLPLLFHAVGGAGQVFLPMHIPVLAAGLFLGSRVGILVGLLTPALSTLLTGMPPAMPMLPIMLAELAAYGWGGGYFSKRLPLWGALCASMAVGRLAAVVVVAGLANFLALPVKPIPLVVTGMITGLPGIVIQLCFVPVVVRRLQLYYGGAAEKRFCSAQRVINQDSQ